MEKEKQQQEETSPFQSLQETLALDRMKIGLGQYDRVDDFGEFKVVYVGRHPYILKGDDVYDPFQVPGVSDNPRQAAEHVLNWTLPGLQLFYRDTDEPYPGELPAVWDVLRAGFFIDVSPYAGRPMHKYRYVIASAHAAQLCDEGDRYPLYTLHCDSYLQVLDVYEKDGVTQLLLLHVPGKAIFWPGFDMNLNGVGLVDIARKSLDDKLLLPPRDNLEEEEWLERTRWHVGYDSEGKLFSMPPHITDSEEVEEFGKAVRVLGDDTDPINRIWEVD